MHRTVRFRVRSVLNTPAFAPFGLMGLMGLIGLIAILPLVVPASPARAAGMDDVQSSVDDALLELKVKASLLDRLGTDAFGIDVEVVGDTVVLIGSVEKRATQELAEEVALSVKGVDSVRNKIALEEPKKAEKTEDTPIADGVARGVSKAEREVKDAVLEVRVKRRLLEEIGRHALDLEVEATDGTVTLRGRLPDRERERLALRTARKTRGVDKVIDLIEH